MASSIEPRSGLNYGWSLGESGWHVGVNENWTRIGRFGFHLSVKDRDLSAPPGSPAAGDSYIVAASATGDWAGKDGQVAVFAGTDWVFGEPRAGWKSYVEDEAVLVVWSGSAWTAVGGGGSGPLQAIPIAAGDETTPIEVGAGLVTFRSPFAFTLDNVRASVTTAQASGDVLTVDVKVNGASILSTLITIDNTEKTSTTAATAPVISSASIADDAEITIDVTQVGDGSAAGLKVYLIGRPA